MQERERERERQWSVDGNKQRAIYLYCESELKERRSSSDQTRLSNLQVDWTLGAVRVGERPTSDNIY